MEETSFKSFKDFFVNRLFSRKLIVWIVGTVLLCFKFIDQNTWVLLAVSYMGLNTALAAIDTIKSFKDKAGSQTSSSSTITTSSSETVSSEKEGEA